MAMHMNSGWKNNIKNNNKAAATLTINGSANVRSMYVLYVQHEICQNINNNNNKNIENKREREKEKERTKQKKKGELIVVLFFMSFVESVSINFLDCGWHIHFGCMECVCMCICGV